MKMRMLNIVIQDENKSMTFVYDQIKYQLMRIIVYISLS